MKRTLVFWGLFVFLLSCQSEVQRQLDLADSLLEEHPDSSLVIVSQIETEHLTRDRDKAYYALVMSAARDKNYIDTPEDSLVNIAVDYYSIHGDAYARMRAWYYQGIVRINAKQYTAAIVSLERAEKEAERLNDLRFIGLINRNKAKAFNATNNFEGAIKYNNIALSAFEHNNDSIYAEYLKYSLAINYLNNRDTKNSRLLFKDLINHSRSKEIIANSRVKYAMSLVAVGDSLQTAINLYRTTPKRYLKYLDYGYYAYALAHTGQRDSAERWINAGYHNAHNRASRATYDYLIAKIDSLDGNYLDAYSKISYAARLQDSLTKVLLQQSLANAQRDYYQQEMAIQEGRLQKRRIISGAVGVIVFLSFVVIALLWVDQRKRKDAIIKEQMARLVLVQSSSWKENRSLMSIWFMEKIARLGGLSDRYYTSEDLLEKEEALRQFKKGVSELKHPEHWSMELENNLNKYCSGIMEKLGAQVPRIKGDNRTIIALFFAGIPDSIIQLLMSRASTGSLRTLRSRLRREIKEAHAPDEALFLEMLNVSDKPKWQ